MLKCLLLSVNSGRSREAPPEHKKRVAAGQSSGLRGDGGANIPTGAPHAGAQGVPSGRTTACGSGILSPRLLHVHSRRSEIKKPTTALSPISSL